MAIKLEKLSKIYNRPVIVDMDLEVSSGEFISIMGPSGTGKSTLLKILAMQIYESAGKYYIDGLDVSTMTYDQRASTIAKDIGYVDQEIYLFDSLTVGENIKLASYNASGSYDDEYFTILCQYFKLSELVDKYPFEISGGERQRTVIVRNLLKKPKFLLMDEPTSSLDYKTSEELLTLLARFQSEFNITVIIVTHNSNVAKHSKRVILLKDGKIYSNVYPISNDFEHDINNAVNGMYRRDYDRN